MEEVQLRKGSLQDGEINCSEIEEDENDTRRNITQKLIKNKNHQYIGDKKPLKDKTLNLNKQDDVMYDKRCRSETPNKMSATDVLYRAHLKLQSRRKLSPSKLQEIHLMKQKKAEEFRAQVESSRKTLSDKIRIRQKAIKNRWRDMLAEKKAKLYDKLGQAVERRESEIQSLKNKAKQELLKIDETNYIMKLTMNNLKMDLDIKMNETLERRNQLLEEYKHKHQQDRQLKMEAAEKRRQELQKESESKFQSNQQRREQADLRRKIMLKQKKKSAEEEAKRQQILKRKNELGDKISDIMSFISNSENIWEFLSNDLDWSDFYHNDGEAILYDLISKDHYQIERLKLKKDAEILNQLIIVTEDGQIFARKELIATALKKMSRHNECYDSSSGGNDSEEEEKDLYQHSSPEKNNLEFKQSLDGGYFSDYSDKGSVDDNLKSSMLSNNMESHLQNLGMLTDEDQNYRLYSIRVKMSMKRNILKRNLSEDLTWADFLKNEYYYKNPQQSNPFNLHYNRSLHSTPERKHDIPSESDKESENIHSVLTTSVNGSNNKQTGKVQSNSDQSNSQNQLDKSRTSQQVYPSKKKKNPNSKAQNQNNQNNLSSGQEQKSSGSQNSCKKIGSGSNQGSTQSLMAHNHGGSFVNQDSLRDSQVTVHRKNTFAEHSGDSGRKKAFNRIHSSSVQESSHINLMPLNQISNNTLNQEEVVQNNFDKLSESQQLLQSSNAHTGTQMTQLITNNKPNPPQTKIVPKKLTANAVKILFPIREQKLLFKRPGKEGQFGKCRISVKIEDLLIQKNNLIIAQQQQINSNLQQVLAPIDNNNVDLLAQKQFNEPIQTTSSRKSLQSTPSQSNRRQSTDTNNSSQILPQSQSMSNIQNSYTTQTSQTSQTNQDQSLSSQFQIGTPTQASRLTLHHQKLQTLLNFESKIPKITGSKMGSNLPSENSPSPRKDIIHDKSFNQVVEESIQLNQSTDQHIVMNEQGYKECIIKIIMTDNVQLIKTEDSQKTIVFDGIEGEKIIDYLEGHDFQLRYCRLCDLIIADHLTNEGHLNLKAHKRTREDLGIKESEDMQYSIFSLVSVPGDIDKELIREKEKALKRKVKRIKAQMMATADSHESASYCPGKEITSVNKKRFQIFCIDLEKQVIPIIKDYEALENTLKEIIRLMEMRKQADLHVLRKLKFIPILIEICKRISVCHRNEFKYLGRVLESVIKIINLFCGLRENRNYMLQTNRLSALIELLNWCLNRPTQLLYGITFLPQLFHILSQHIKHRAPYECQQMKELFIEYLICSQITMKIKGKLQIINGPLDMSEMIGQVPLFLLKSASFIEALTSLISIDAKFRPVYEKTSKIGEQVFFVISNNELFGIIPMITTILLSRNQPFKPSTQSQPISITKVLPQTILSLAIISIKIINNIFRMDYRFTQQMLNDFEIQDQLYILFNYLLVYGVEASGQQEDSKELLHETLIMIGYFSLFNEKNQQLLCKGENTILQKLCNLPFPYFCDKKLKEILFPTLIQATYKNERSLAIMDQEISIDLIVDFLQINLKEELPKIIEEDCDYQSMSSLGGGQLIGNNLERKTNRSPSISSTNSSNCSLQLDLVNGNSPFLPLYMRFPKKQWKDAVTFYQKVLY